MADTAPIQTTDQAPANENATVNLDISALGALREGTNDQARKKLLAAVKDLELTSENVSEITEAILGSGAINTTDKKAAMKKAGALAVYFINNPNDVKIAAEQNEKAADVPATEAPKKDEKPEKTAEDGLAEACSDRLKMLSVELNVDLKDLKSPNAAAKAILAHKDLVLKDTAYDGPTWKAKFGYEPHNDDETKTLNLMLAALADDTKIREPIKDKDGKITGYNDINQVVCLEDFDAGVTEANVKYFRATDKFHSDTAKANVETAIRAGMLLKKDEEPKELTDVHYQEYFNKARSADVDTGKPITQRFDVMTEDERTAHFNKFLEFAGTDTNLASALAVIVDHKDDVAQVYGTKGLANMGEEFWRGMGYQPDGSMGSSEIKAVNLLYLRAQYSPEFAAFIKTKLAGLGEGAQHSAEAAKEAKEAEGVVLFRELGMTENEEFGILPGSVNFQSAVDTIYRYVTLHGDGAKINLTKKEWGKDGLFSSVSGRAYEPTGLGLTISRGEHNTLCAILNQMYENGKVDQDQLAILRKHSSFKGEDVKGDAYATGKDPLNDRLKGTPEQVKEKLNKELQPETKLALKLISAHPEYEDQILAALGFTPEAVQHFHGRQDLTELALDLMATGELTKGGAKGRLNPENWKGRGFTAELIEGTTRTTGRGRNAETTKTAGTLDVLSRLRKERLDAAKQLAAANKGRADESIPALPAFDFKREVKELNLFLNGPEGKIAFENGTFERENSDQEMVSGTFNRYDQTKFHGERVGDSTEYKREVLAFLCDFNLDGITDGKMDRQVKKGQQADLLNEAAIYLAINAEPNAENPEEGGLTDVQTARATLILAQHGGLNLAEEVKKGTFTVAEADIAKTVKPEDAAAFIRNHPAVKPYVTAGLNEIAKSKVDVAAFIRIQSDEIDRAAALAQKKADADAAKNKLDAAAAALAAAEAIPATTEDTTEKDAEAARKQKELDDAETARKQKELDDAETARQNEILKKITEGAGKDAGETNGLVDKNLDAQRKQNEQMFQSQRVALSIRLQTFIEGGTYGDQTYAGIDFEGSDDKGMVDNKLTPQGAVFNAALSAFDKAHDEYVEGKVDHKYVVDLRTALEDHIMGKPKTNGNDKSWEPGVLQRLEKLGGFGPDDRVDTAMLNLPDGIGSFSKVVEDFKKSHAPAPKAKVEKK